jgi:two-component system sensor histidine kinase RegB
MAASTTDVWHVVARLRLLRGVTCGVLWVGCAAALAAPMADLPLREAAPFGLVVALARTLVVIAQTRRGKVPELLLGVSLVCDAVLLTLLLDITGGLFNPFVFMYAVYVWLTVATTSRRWGLLVATVSAAGFAWLVFDHLDAGQVAHHRLNDVPTHLFTTWVSLTAIAELVSHYVERGARARQAQQQAVDEARARAARSEHQAALMTLAAGAAHELSTPLATIAVAARELELGAGRLSGPSPEVVDLQADARLIRAEVDRCQVVLDAMTGRATSGHAAEVLSVTALVERVRERLAEGTRGRLQVELAVRDDPAIAWGAEAVQALGVLLKNAFDASDAGSPVVLRIRDGDGVLRFEVHDRGPGMTDEVLRRVGEPFFTTKEAGQGSGLGVFLARAFAERLSGTLEFERAGGTTAVMEIPLRVGGRS